MQVDVLSRKSWMKRWLGIIVMILVFTCGFGIKAKAATSPYIKLNKTVYVLPKGKKYTLKKTVASKYKKKKVVWTSSKKSVATVSSKGVVKGRKKGTATITAKIKGTSQKVTCKVVVGTPVSSLSLKRKSITLFTGQKYSYPVTVKPSSASVKKVTYSSSATSVATVSTSGKVTAVAPGTAKITIQSTDGHSKKTYLNVTVKEGIVTSDNVNVNERVLQMVSYLDKYSSFIKKYGSLCYKSGSNNVLTYQAAVELASAKKKISLNCTCPMVWALKDMGIIPKSSNIYGTAKGFHFNSTAQEDLLAVATSIKSGKAMGMTMQEAAEAGLLQYGDMLSMTYGSNGNHSAIFAGFDEEGNALGYESGGDAQKLGYSNVGCGPFDYSGEGQYTITEIIRFK